MEEDGRSDSPSTGNRNSLRDRFKLLRMREEAGITTLDEEMGQTSNVTGGALAGLIGRSASVSIGIGSPTPLTEEKDDQPPQMSRMASSPGPTSVGPPKTPTVNVNLAPGTASGISAGPASDSAPPVDWDLWQTVVYEGPTAVARSSPEELNQAIAAGIPHAIRGVVWQVLAQSKNEELENVYRELVARGTDKEKPPSPSIPRNDSHPNGYTKEKGSIASSASSVHSDSSTPATSTSQPRSASPTSGDVTGLEAMTKALAEKQKKQKEEAAKIQRLEKTIRRDLGARTSYSKYLVAANLQEGLFGVCKAYALFDQEVGYAQGMNFIAMPLLFHVS
jgi:hypothetical protein